MLSPWDMKCWLSLLCLSLSTEAVFNSRQYNLQYNFKTLNALQVCKEMSPSKQTLCQVLSPAQCWAPSLNPICIWSLNKTWLHQQCISCIHEYTTLDLGHCHQMPHLLCVPGHTPVKDKRTPKIKSCCGNPETHWHLQIGETVIETSPFTLPSINKPQHTASTNPQSFH